MGEFALVTVDRTRVEQAAEEDDRGARRVLAALRRLSFELSGAQLGITVASIVLGFVSEPIVTDLLNRVPGVELVPGSATAVVVALTLSTVATMVFGELVPKSLAIARPLQTARAIVVPLGLFSWFFGPLIRVLNGLANVIVRMVGVEPVDELESVRSLEEMEILVRSSVERGAVDAATLPLLRRTISFSEKDAREALIPRVSVVALPVTAHVSDLAAAANASGHSRIVVYAEGGDVDDAIGVVHVKDALRVPRDHWDSTTIADFVDDVPFVPESRDLESILTELAATGRPFAIVVDEYGGTAGVVTLEDVLEEIVGEIEDEYDLGPEVEGVMPPADVEIVSGMAHADELAEQTGFVLPEGEFETVAGFILDRLGRIPAVGDRVFESRWTLEVVAMEGRRVDRVRVVGPTLDGPSGPSAQDDR